MRRDIRSRRNGSSTRTRAFAAAILAAAPLAASDDAHAVVRSWIALDGNWSTPGNWSTGVVPTAGDDAVFVNGDSTARTITYNYTGPAVSLLAVRVSGGVLPSGHNSIVQSANVLTTSNEQIGIDGRGSYHLSGGTNTVTNTLTLSVNSNGRGVYNLSGTGNLSAGSIVIGASGGLATFNQSAGQLTTTQGGVVMGQNAGAGGFWALDGGVARPRSIVIGGNGFGRVDHTGGFNTATLDIKLGVGTAAAGVYNLSGTGFLNLEEGSGLVVGEGGTGTFSHTGGSFSSSSHTVLGNLPGSRGAYTLDGADAELRARFMTVGSSGIGTFTQNAGVHRILTSVNGSEFLQLGSGTGSTGVYMLNGGTLEFDSSFSRERIGIDGAGTFVQSGGFHSVRGTQFIGDASAGGAGTYLLNNGALQVEGQQVAPSGRFIQTGGTSKVTRSTDVNGTYTLDGGALTYAAAALTVGAGTFVQNGGTNNIGEPPPIPGFPNTSTGSLFVGGFGESDGGHYRLAGGTLSGNGAFALIGNNAGDMSANTFEQTGGVNNFNGLMVIGNLDATPAGGGTYLFNGGSLAVNPTTVIDINSGVELLLDGLVLTDRGTFASNTPTGEFFGKFTHDGGTVTGTLRNRGTYVFNRGTFAGEMINRGTFALNGGTFAAPTAMTNEEVGVINARGTFAVPITNRGALNTTGALAAASVSNVGEVNVPAATSFSPAFLNNFGRVNLRGGRLLGNGTLSNNAGGVGGGGIVAGGGTVTLNVVQNGGILRADDPANPLILTAPLVTTNPSSQTIIAPNSMLGLQAPTNNPAVISLQGSGARLTGATITNAPTGTIKGAGDVANQFLNFGIVRAEGAGALTFTDPNNGNFTTGQIQVGAGAVRFPTGMQVNNGTISLADGEFDNGAGSMESTGRIIGRGTYRGGTLTNGGTIIFSGGASDVFAPLVNANRVNVTSGGAASFYDAVDTSVGTINVNLGSTATFFGPVTGIGHFTGAGVKEFEASASGGAIDTRDGATVVGPAGNLTAQFIRDAHLSVVGRATIPPNGTALATSRVNVLEIDGSPDNWNGRLDLTNNALVIDHDGDGAATIETVRSQLRSGRAGGAWTGNGIATSSGNAAQFALGYAPSTALFTSFPATFSGQSVDDTSVLIAFTRYGDANLDRVVNLADFNRLASNFGQSNRFWHQGDFNYDSVVNLNDFNLLAANFGLSASGPEVTPQDWANLAAVVPEPGAAGVLGLCAAGASVATRTRRRRRSG